MPQPFNQPLNEQLRDALLALYLTHVLPEDTILNGHQHSVKNADDLYAHWLLDVQVSQAVSTSRVACAIASVQQYISAITLGLEPGYETVGLSPEQLSLWHDNLHAYPVWRARQHLRHFPANYLSPMLRSNKTDSFQQLENDINQCRIQSDTVLSAVQSYLARFEEVANLKTLNGYIDGEKDQFATSNYYFVAKSSAENTYYWRSLDMSQRSLREVADNSSTLYQHDIPEPGAWSDWKKIPLAASENIPQHSIRPVCFNNRLLVIWAQYINPMSTGDNAPDGLWQRSEESEKDYKARLEHFLKSRYVQLRLYFSYLKFDGSWSVPQVCSDEYCVMRSINALSKEALSAAISTFAVLDSSTRPASLFFGLNAHALNQNSEKEEYSSGDFFQALRLDQNFTVQRVLSKGTLADFKAHPEHQKNALRYLSVFGYHNRHNFNFRAPSSATVKPDSFNNLSPHTGSDGWDYESTQHRISDINENDITFNTTSSVLEVTARLNQDFPEHQIVLFKTGPADRRLEIRLVVQLPKGKSNNLSLQPGSSISMTPAHASTPAALGQSLSITCKESGITFANFITRPPAPLEHSTLTELAGMSIDYSVFKFIFANPNSNPDYDITVNVDGLENRTFNDLQPTSLTRTYKHLFIIPRHESSTLPQRLHRENSSIIGEPNISRRQLREASLRLDATQDFSAQVQLNPQTRRPYEQESVHESKPSNSITIIHGVLIFETDTRHADNTILGYALKALNVTLDPHNSKAIVPLAPRIGRLSSNTDGTAEFIDFAGSTIQTSDDNSTPRAPIRMNTGFAKQLATAASVSLDTLFSLTANAWLEPALTQDGAAQPLDFHGAHGKYFWELFLYLPWLVAHRLNMEQRYAEAESWLRYIFDPGAKPAGAQQSPAYWKLQALTPTTPEPSYARNNPDDPNQIALSAPVHLRQALYGLYLDTLFNRGDAAYRQITADSLAEAKLWYVRVKSLLGPRPAIIQADPWQPATLGALSAAPAQQASAKLCLPLNPELVARWDKIESRLHNLRHGLTLTGSTLQVPLYAAALTPQTLLNRSPHASQTGRDQSPTPLAPDVGHYRFQSVYGQAMAMLDNVIQLGATVLLLFERKEQAEHLELQQHYAWDLAKIALDQQVQHLAYDEKNQQALLAGRRVIEARLSYFERQLKEGISPAETRASQEYLDCARLETMGYAAQAGAGLAMLAPNIFGTSNGGMRIEGTFYAIQATVQGVANEKRSSANHLDRTEQFNRRAQEWTHAMDQCRLELSQVDAQLHAYAEQTASHRLQLRHTETTLEHARLTYQMLSKRFSSAQLFQWLNSQLATFYYQAYDAAQALCLSAQASWQFERADWSRTFIHSHAWNNQYRGLSAGESLKLNLQNMHAAYLQHNQRELEISKTISLRQLHGKDSSATLNKAWPALSNELISNGSVDFELTPALFDADYPGHYLRRIKSVSVSLPATLGPYEDIRAILTQTYNSTQMSENPQDKRDNMRVSEQIALSTGLSDSGLFTLSFDTDERYLPFEYTGAVSRWRLTFPNHSAQASMLTSLTDIIVHVRYTARSAGGRA